jgi:hypothetical protein
MEYRCELGCCTQVAQLSILHSFSNSETELVVEYRADNCTYLIELNVRKPWVASISQRSEELRRYNLVLNVTISNPSLKAVSSENASPG